MGSAPYPLSAASAAGSTLGLAEQGKAQRNQTCADEYQQHGIAGHDVPDILDQRGQCGGVTQNPEQWRQSQQWKQLRQCPPFIDLMSCVTNLDTR